MTTVVAEQHSQPEPRPKNFRTLMTEIENGQVKIPQFQRDFVWDLKKSAKLVDSLLKGYPIGTFILWKTKELLRTVRNLGDHTLPSTPEGDYSLQVLDGQQRLTSLYAAVHGLTVEVSGKTQEFSKLLVNLAARGEEEFVVVDAEEADDQALISVKDLLTAKLTKLKLPEKHLERIEVLRERLHTYSFSVIEVKEAPIEVATEIFTRINVTGKALTVFEIMVAKTFNPSKEFDLAVATDALYDQLAKVGYSTVPHHVVLQTVAAILRREVRTRTILALPRDEFIQAWPQALDALKLAIDHFRKTYRIPVSGLLPFGALLVPFAYFFTITSTVQRIFGRTTFGTSFGACP